MRIVFPLAAGFVLAVQPASAQEASLADFLVTQASCMSPIEARASLEQALGLTPPDTSRDVILEALRQVASRDDLCTELRDAAGAFADQVVAPAAPPAAEVEPPKSPTPSELVVAALVEAERRAANLTFEVAPPPRFMTRERNPGR